MKYKYPKIKIHDVKNIANFQISRNLVQFPKIHEKSTSGPRALKSVGPRALKSAGGPWDPFRPKSGNLENQKKQAPKIKRAYFRPRRVLI